MQLARITLLLVVLALMVGCGDDDEATPTDTGTITLPAETEVKVYWLLGGKVWPARREVNVTGGIENAAIAALLEGPTQQESADLAFTTAIPEGVDDVEIDLADGVATVETDTELPDEPLAQLVYTLTEFPTVESVEIQDRMLARGDFEDLTPAILVESPLPFEEVESPLTVTGTANTFEANFQYNLTDTDGLIVDENFVTATSGTGTRGTFEFTTKEYTVPFDGIGALIVFEASAKDGSRINLVEIPLRMKKE